jgi:hypothetical protein
MRKAMQISMESAWKFVELIQQRGIPEYLFEEVLVTGIDKLMTDYFLHYLALKNGDSIEFPLRASKDEILQFADRGYKIKPKEILLSGLDNCIFTGKKAILIKTNHAFDPTLFALTLESMGLRFGDIFEQIAFDASYRMLPIEGEYGIFAPGSEYKQLHISPLGRETRVPMSLYIKGAKQLFLAHNIKKQGLFFTPIFGTLYVLAFQK